MFANVSFVSLNFAIIIQQGPKTHFMVCFSQLLFVFLLPDPFILPRQQVDKGAIKFVLSGANIMCPGLTSPGAKLDTIGAEAIVVSFPTEIYDFCISGSIFSSPAIIPRNR